jgi:hypothetical protein
MAKKRRRKYSRGSGEEVRREINRRSRLHFRRRARKEREFRERSAEGVPQKVKPSAANYAV